MLGPSGCGKTSTLRLIAGFEKLDSGSIKLDGVDMAAKPPHKRPVNTVFQSYALFPHMTVAENVAFGLRYKKVGKAETARRVGEAMELVQLGTLASRRPGPALGRPAAAGRAGAGDRARTAGAAAGRAARRPGRAAARGSAGRAQADPGDARDHVRLRHARPGRGADDERPGRGDEGRARRAVRRAAGALRGAGDGVRGELPRDVQPDPGDGLRRVRDARRVHAALRRRRALRARRWR